MRIINVIITSEECPIVSIDSFGIFEEQLSDEVVEKAEKLFIKKALELGIDEVDAEESLNDGFISNDKGSVIYIIWSDID